MFYKIIYQYKKFKILNALSSYGQNLDIDYNSVFIEPCRMSFGDNVFLNRNAFLSGSIIFKNNIMIGPNFTAFSDNHTFGRVGKSIMSYSKEYVRGKIIIEDECWIGANVKIFGDVTIGFGSIIGGGSIITKNTPPFSMVVGSNEFVRNIFTKEEAYIHLQTLGYEEDIIINVVNSMKVK